MKMKNCKPGNKTQRKIKKMGSVRSKEEGERCKPTQFKRCNNDNDGD